MSVLGLAQDAILHAPFADVRRVPILQRLEVIAVNELTTVVVDAQVLELRLRAELVTLSACESSEKKLLGFKLVSGMTAAIRQAGARNLIASLWPVDELSSQVVPLFYQEYLRGSGSAAALRSAKLALFNKTIAIRGGVRLSLAHPFLWANYVLFHFYR